MGRFLETHTHKDNNKKHHNKQKQSIAPAGHIRETNTQYWVIYCENPTEREKAFDQKSRHRVAMVVLSNDTSKSRPPEKGFPDHMWKLLSMAHTLLKVIIPTAGSHESWTPETCLSLTQSC